MLREEDIKRAILKEMKIKEGAENLRRATSDKKVLANVGDVIREANDTLETLNEQLNEVRAYLLMTSRDSYSTTKRPGKLHFLAVHPFAFFVFTLIILFIFHSFVYCPMWLLYPA